MLQLSQQASSSSSSSPSIIRSAEADLDPNFVDFAHDLAKELGVVRALVNSPTLSASAAETAARFYPSFEVWLDGHLDSLARVFAHVAPEARGRHGEYFREVMRPFTNESRFLARTNDRPRGYAGDSELMRMLYDDQLRGDSVFGCLLHRHPIRSAAAQAVRHRIGLVADVIRAEKRPDGERLRVMSLACGPARELRNVLQTREDIQGIDFVLVDQDPLALDEARKEVRRTNANALVVEASVRDILKGTATLESSFGGEELDVIYALGLFDYLPKSVAKRLLSELVSMLRPGGRLIIGNFHIACATRMYLDVWMNWPLLYRTKTELLDLAADITPVSDLWIDFEPTRSQMFLSIRKAQLK
jgi:extracellular factor (EF) 3-hydroxypalmitic acid methyl ester biosynthesis protein